MPEEVHTVVQPEGERTQRDVSSLPIQKSSPGAHYETETRVKLMFASDEYSHFYTLILKKKVLFMDLSFPGKVRISRYFFGQNFGNYSDNQIYL